MLTIRFGGRIAAAVFKQQPGDSKRKRNITSGARLEVVLTKGGRFMIDRINQNHAGTTFFSLLEHR